jgi:hypothetical protein
MNMAFRRGDNFSTMLDFSVSLSGYTVTSGIQSLVTGESVLPFSVSFASATNGQVNVALTSTQTATIPRGSYGWTLAWTDGVAVRTALTGMVEVS